MFVDGCFKSIPLSLLLIIRDALCQAYRTETIDKLKENYSFVFEIVSNRIDELTLDNNKVED